MRECSRFDERHESSDSGNTRVCVCMYVCVSMHTHIHITVKLRDTEIKGKILTATREK